MADGAATATRHKAPLWAKVAVVLGALLMVTSGAVIVGSRLLISRVTSDITRATLIEGVAGAGAGGNDIDGPVNLLLVGLDEREGRDEEGARSDTIIILHIPASHDQAYLVSIPRDARVDVPAYPKNGYAGGTTKINAAFAAGYEGPGTELEKRARGFDLLAKTINSRTGITFNGAAIIDFPGFEAVVEELGGVDMCVDTRAESIHIGVTPEGELVRGWYQEDVGLQGLPPGAKPLVHETGCRRMSAIEALDYARIRKSLPDGDYGRQRHQQQLLKAIGKEATSKGMLIDPGRLDRVIKAAGKAFVLDTQGVPVEDFLFTFRGLAANDLVLVKTNAGEFASETIDGQSFEHLTPDTMRMLSAVRDGSLPGFLMANPAFVATTE
ncbi:LCP family protein [Phytohabitans kaempferiae]|uniref:LCP family protein n=1 Tax=Phytohabitans kaempferiae TaxID=1620943 RepID=A0ABV6M2G7_9ACTN